MSIESKKVVISLKETWHKMDHLYDTYAKSVGLNFTTILVLELLHDSQEPLTQKDICEILSLPKQVINLIIKWLWEEGYVRLQEAQDRRIKQIILTGSGREYIERTIGPLKEAEEKAWESFSDEEMAALSGIMERFIGVLESLLSPSQK